ncbi:16196_t:CDS:2 [Acaulospora colombiana]|uniref:16196_t:CDS:1 n=1 Tax=Acaulospora colombiana TaxID=27376 RepID=A0ACA9K455_9GLOM|nr:16196_t:CDS:2 [Acaulospora colombiana]
MSISNPSASQTHVLTTRSLPKEGSREIEITLNNNEPSESIKSTTSTPLSSPSIRSVHQFTHIHQKRLSRTIQHISSFLQIIANVTPTISFPVTIEKTFTIERLARQIEAEYAFKFGGIEMVGHYEPLEVGLLYDVSMVALRFRDIIGDVLEHGDVIHVLNIYEDYYPKDFDENSDAECSSYNIDKDLPPIPSTDNVLLPKSSPKEKRFSLPIISHHDNLNQSEDNDQDNSDRITSESPSPSIKQIQNFVQASESRFQAVLANTLSLRYFQKFAIRDFCVENLLFWLDVELFAAGISCDIEDNYFEQQQTAVIHARYIYLTYISPNAPLQVNLSDEIRRETTWPIDEDADVKRDMFDEAQEAVYQLMKGHTFIRFEESPEWKEFLKIKESDPDTYKSHEMTEPLEKYFRPNMSLMLAVTTNLDNGSDQAPISYHYKEQTLHSMLSQYFPETFLGNKGKGTTDTGHKNKMSEPPTLGGYFNVENRMTNAQRMRRLKKERKLQWIFGAKVGRVEDQIVVMPKEPIHGDLFDDDSKSMFSNFSANRKATRDAWNRKRKVDKLESILGRELRDSQTAQNLFKNKPTVIPVSPQKFPSGDNSYLQTVNELSKGDKRKLLKKSKKLQVMLGETLDEEMVRQALGSAQSIQTPVSVSNNGRLSFVSEIGGGRRSEGTGSFTNRRASSDSTVPPPLKAPGTDAPPSWNNNNMENATMDIKNIPLVIVNNATKDYRRKKLQKLHHFLGERVPVNVVFGDDDYEFVPLPPISPKSKNRVQLNSLSLSQKRSSYQPNDISPTNLSPRDKKRHLNRAVKLENLFGEIPPQSLFLSGSLSEKGDLCSDTSSETSSIELHRRSIISLEYLMNNDRETVYDLINYMADSDENSEETDNSKERGNNKELLRNTASSSSAPATPHQANSLNKDSKKVTLKSNRKLSHFFGATYGQMFPDKVLGELLGDLEREIEESSRNGEVDKADAEGLIGQLKGLRVKSNELGPVNSDEDDASTEEESALTDDELLESIRKRLEQNRKKRSTIIQI